MPTEVEYLLRNLAINKEFKGKNCPIYCWIIVRLSLHYS